MRIVLFNGISHNRNPFVCWFVGLFFLGGFGLWMETTGYRRYYDGLRQFLSTQPFANQIQIIGKEDRMVTGNFEVTLFDTGQVIHSKRHAGQGRAQTMQERMAIAEQIQEYLDDLASDTEQEKGNKTSKK